MYQSPVVQVFSQENTTTAPKKPGATDTSLRPPLQDKAVNPTSPKRMDIHQTERDVQCERTPQQSIQHIDDDDLFFYDTCSYNDSYDDLSSQDLGIESPKAILHILRAHFNIVKTPPPLDFDGSVLCKIQETDCSFDSGYDFTPETLDVSFPEIDFD